LNRKERRNPKKHAKTVGHLKLVSMVKAAKKNKNSVNHLGENIEIQVLIPRLFAEKALKDQKLWKDLWGDIVPGQCRQAALELKALVLNDFQPVTTPEQMKAAHEKMVELEKPGPVLSVVIPPMGDGMPNVDDPNEMAKLLRDNGFKPSDKRTL
jgi:hypothetical protein